MFVMVKAGPGECQPDRVGPRVSQRLATPLLTVVVPGPNGLLLNDAVPFAPAVTSKIFGYWSTWNIVVPGSSLECSGNGSVLAG